MWNIITWQHELLLILSPYVTGNHVCILQPLLMMLTVCTREALGFVSARKLFDTEYETATLLYDAQCDIH